MRTALPAESGFQQNEEKDERAAPRMTRKSYENKIKTKDTHYRFLGKQYRMTGRRPMPRASCHYGNRTGWMDMGRSIDDSMI
ncbi:hypothetical protein AVEN_209805-1 [Araneus ventricosus]|uniref:Uncharacterized protein n=1 Tax=Araneus ventricosus TaxID=182803 RepID=A0A4Y2MU30_ARAVE|nr:hypothetical protein AVEN_247045-1 [Araneus ventricosus]GBN29810.1 hypothetical protein AVEN_273630-1 [Araneus ventricosus]GBN29844.1 hypothetical protein AVEN_160729-1 [Araneus ventricosus]GBN29856.1 hypothetical protein AVEN_209805-1 [Araneus ventricosus]